MGFQETILKNVLILRMFSEYCHCYIYLTFKKYDQTNNFIRAYLFKWSREFQVQVESNLSHSNQSNFIYILITFQTNQIQIKVLHKWLKLFFFKVYTENENLFFEINAHKVQWSK